MIHSHKTGNSTYYTEYQLDIQISNIHFCILSNITKKATKQSPFPFYNSYIKNQNKESII